MHPPWTTANPHDPEAEAHHGRLQRYAQEKVYRAIKSGKMVKGTVCSRCNRHKDEVNSMHAHHEDYDQPLMIVWLCARCHGVRHGEITRAAWAKLEAEGA